MLEPLAPDAARPLVYDFDLLDKEVSSDLNNCSLRDLAFVVFDSETTGLDPVSDDVVQLGAVRVVNGKIVKGEVFDTFVNPGRPIPPGGSALSLAAFGTRRSYNGSDYTFFHSVQGRP